MAGIKGKAPVLILGILILVSLSLVVVSYTLLQKEKTNNLALQDQLEDMGMKQRISEAKLEESKKMISGLEQKLQEAQGRIDGLTSDLNQEKNSRQDSLLQIDQLKAELDKQKALSSDLDNKLNQAREELKKAQTKLNELVSKKAELETKIKDLEEQAKKVELGTIVVDSGASSDMPATQMNMPDAKEAQAAPLGVQLEGKILVLNKEYNFVVINLGSKDGIKIGDLFSVYHENQYLGDVTIGKIHDAMASGDFDSQEIKNKVREGDKVIQKSK